MAISSATILKKGQILIFNPSYMKRIILLIVLLGSIILLQAQDLSQGFKLLKKGKVPEAKEFFIQNKNFCLTKAGLLKIAILNNDLLTVSQLNDAFISSSELVDCYNNLAQKERNNYKKYITIDDILDLYNTIDLKYYKFVIDNHRIQFNDIYLQACVNSKHYPAVYSFADSCEFSQSRDINTIDSYNIYFKKYPKGNYWQKAFFAIEDIRYIEVKRKNSLTDYYTFLKDFPETKYRAEIILNIEDPVYLKAKNENSEIAFNKYLIEYPNGKFVKEALSAIEEIIFSKTKIENSESAFNFYLGKYPNGKYMNEALFAIEKIAFRSAAAISTEQSLSSYLTRFPEGKYKLKAKYMLDNIGKLPPLIRDLNHSDSGARTKAILALGDIGSPIAVDPLLNLLKQDNWVQNQDVAEALGKIGDSRAVEPLIKNLSEFGIGPKAAIALGQIGDTLAIKPLIASLGDSWASDNAAEALAQIGGERVFQLLIDTLDSYSNDVKENVILALSKLNDPRASKYIIRLLLDDELEVAKAASNALDDMKIVPEGDDRYYYYIAKGKKYVNIYWADIKGILLDNLRNGELIEYSVTAFIWIGKNEIIKDLIEIMNNQSGTLIPVAFLNCGQPELRKAAEKWAKDNNYNIIYNSNYGGYGRWGG